MVISIQKSVIFGSGIGVGMGGQQYGPCHAIPDVYKPNTHTHTHSDTKRYTQSWAIYT